MPRATNPLKWQGAEALTALGLCQFKFDGEPVFYRSQSEIVPVFIFRPKLKWGIVNTQGYVGLSFSNIDGFAKSLGKAGGWPSFMIHTANFPGDLWRYVYPDEADHGAFEDWAGSIDRCLRKYPTSAKEMAMQLREGRLGGYRGSCPTAWCSCDGSAIVISGEPGFVRLPCRAG
jgi:hypothetical protein